MRRQGIAIGIALAIVLGTLAVVLSGRERRLLGTNSLVVGSKFAVGVPPHEGTRCQYGVLVPKGTGTLRLFAGLAAPATPAVGPIDVTIAASHGHPVAIGNVKRVGTQTLLVPIDPLRRTLRSAEICVVNRGVGAVVFAGAQTPVQLEFRDKVRGEAVEDVRVDFLTPNPHSWWSVATPIARRFSLFRPSFVGTWTLFAIVGVVLALWGAGIATLLGRPRR